MITVSLEQAKMLKDLWRKKECHFVEEVREDIDWVDVIKEDYRMPTAQEIIDELPTVIEVWRIAYMLTMTKKSALYLDVDIWDNFHTRATIIVFDWETLADALADLWVRCKKNGYLTSKHTEETKT